MAQDFSPKLLLIDEQFRARLDHTDKAGDDIAAVLLERLNITGQYDCLGSVELQKDQTWLARILGGPGELVIVARVRDRFDAIVALWSFRAEAFVGQWAH